MTLGTVDGDPRVRIEMHTFVGSKAPWDHIGGTPSVSGRPTKFNIVCGHEMTSN